MRLSRFELTLIIPMLGAWLVVFGALIVDTFLYLPDSYELFLPLGFACLNLWAIGSAILWQVACPTEEKERTGLLLVAALGCSAGLILVIGISHGLNWGTIPLRWSLYLETLAYGLRSSLPWVTGPVVGFCWVGAVLRWRLKVPVAASLFRRLAPLVNGKAIVLMLIGVAGLLASSAVFAMGGEWPPHSVALRQASESPIVRMGKELAGASHDRMTRHKVRRKTYPQMAEGFEGHTNTIRG